MPKKREIKKKNIGYSTPLFEEQTTMTFPDKVWKKINGKRYRQVCSRCHHCR